MDDFKHAEKPSVTVLVHVYLEAFYHISLFAAFYSLLLQLYMGLKVLHEIKESKMIIFLAVMLALTFIEMFLTSTTVNFSNNLFKQLFFEETF